MAKAMCKLAGHGVVACTMMAATVHADGNLNYAFGGAGWGVPGSPDFVAGSATCASGKKQSPVNVDDAAVSTPAMSPLNLVYEKSESWSMLASYNYLEVEEISTVSKQATATSTSGNGITMDANGYTMTGASADGLYVPLSQYHFHSPSENTINGMHFPLEMHMVHKRWSNPLFANGTLVVATVVAIMFRLDPADAPNPFVDQILYGPLSPEQIQKFLNSSLSHQFEEEDAPDQFSLMDEVFSVTGTSKYYAFTGSLTTPPCTEGLNWRVLATPLTISRAQLQAFKNALSQRQMGYSRGGDNRDVQPLNGRTVMASFVPGSGTATADGTRRFGHAGLLSLVTAALVFLGLA
jgi:carbonic anhydrase